MNQQEFDTVRDVDRQETNELAWHLCQAYLWDETHSMLEWYCEVGGRPTGTTVHTYSVPRIGR